VDCIFRSEPLRPYALADSCAINLYTCTYARIRGCVTDAFARHGSIAFWFARERSVPVRMALLDASPPPATPGTVATSRCRARPVLPRIEGDRFSRFLTCRTIPVPIRTAPDCAIRLTAPARRPNFLYGTTTLAGFYLVSRPFRRQREGYTVAPYAGCDYLLIVCQRRLRTEG